MPVARISDVETEDLKTRARALRAAGNTPKQIARTLGIPRAQATALVRGVRAERPNRAAPDPKPLTGCWVTRQWSNGLTIEDRPADWIDDEDLPPLVHGAGLASVAVVREHDETGLVKRRIEPGGPIGGGRSGAYRHFPLLGRTSAIGPHSKA